MCSCDRLSQRNNLDDTGIVIATVDGRYLYAAELENVIHPAVSREDSAGLANSYINQWIRDQLLMTEASNQLSSDLEIERLVDDYREKLIKFNFENKILEERYDTIVTDAQLSHFYDENKEQFVLAEPIYQIQYAEVPNSAKRISTFYRNWRRNNKEEISKYLKENATISHLEDETWHDWKDILQYSDRFSESRATRIDDQHVSDGDLEYFLKITGRKEARDIAPQSYVRAQLIHMILHNRKKDIIEDYKTELYNKAIRDNKIQTR